MWHAFMIKSPTSDNDGIEDVRISLVPCDGMDALHTVSFYQFLLCLNCMRWLVLQLILSEIWRWRRRGGGMEDEGGNARPHARALQELQNLEPQQIDYIT